MKQIDDYSKELLVTNYFKEINTDNYKFSENQYSRWDYAYRIEDNIVVGELKQRSFNSTQYPDTMIERSKYDYIRAANKAKGVGGELVVMFNDCYYVFDVINSKVKYDSKVCPKTTSFQSREYVVKDVVLFNLQDGIRYEYIQ